jgi:hypothetical protein|tara:strand:- start:563 stop:820 length:258 start_codon:yes stop_codon:yes gene_type:complete
MPANDWTEKLRDILDVPRERKPMTLAQRALVDDWADRFAAAMEVHAAQTERNIAILGAHLAANDGDVDFATLEQMLETGAPPTVH